MSSVLPTLYVYIVTLHEGTGHFPVDINLYQRFPASHHEAGLTDIVYPSQEYFDLELVWPWSQYDESQNDLFAEPGNAVC